MNQDEELTPIQVLIVLIIAMGVFSIIYKMAENYEAQQVELKK